jgi:CheY-like chemotaxis protein/anti-sigma regulatory factor (Ser/Thr protein kinase)
VRTPLNGILGLGELLQRDLPGGEPRQRMDLLLQSARHLDRMIGDLLDLSRMEVDRLELQLAPFSPSQALHEVVELMRPQAQARGCSLHLLPDLEADALALGDVARVRQVLYNLLGNAIKLGAGQPVTLRCQRQGDRIRYEVEDGGGGIDPIWADRIFQAFERGPAEHGTPGAGLGLAVCRQLARSMGGDIAHRARTGGGTCFGFDFVAPAATAPPCAPEPAPQGLQGRVLVVDDNEVNALVARAMLERLGLKVDVARDGDAALARMLDTGFDAVLMDVQMPGTDGLEAPRLWRASERAQDRGRALPIVGLTANVSGEELRACLASGMDAVLAKPCSMDALARTLALHLVLPRSQAAGA